MKNLRDRCECYYGGETISELEEMFRESVDEFVEGYKNNNLNPPVSFRELDLAKV